MFIEHYLFSEQCHHFRRWLSRITVIRFTIQDESKKDYLLTPNLFPLASIKINDKKSLGTVKNSLKGLRLLKPNKKIILYKSFSLGNARI
jgi:hypothetical protein